MLGLKFMLHINFVCFSFGDMIMDMDYVKHMIIIDFV
jgi:hypothetical protein